MNLHLLNSTGSFIVVGSGIQVVSHRTIGAKMAIEKTESIYIQFLPYIIDNAML